MPKNNKSKNNKSHNKQSSKSHDDDMAFLDAYIKENKNISSEISEKQKSPLEKSLEEAKKNENRDKLRKAIYMKQQMRGMPSKKEIQTQQDLLNEMMKHPKMTNEILQLYGKAIEYNPTKTLPSPLEIFDNDEKYRIEYYQYIIGIIDSLKEQKKDIKFLNRILDNPYGHYMSKCLGCPLNPFDKTKSTQQNQSSDSVNNLLNGANVSSTTEVPKDTVPLKEYDDISDADDTDDEDVSDENTTQANTNTVSVNV